MVCPCCLNNDNDKFTIINGHFTFNVRYDGPRELSLYICNECSNVMVDNYYFKQKEDPNKKEED